jgi:hypothetical protein
MDLNNMVGRVPILLNQVQWKCPGFVQKHVLLDEKNQNPTDERKGNVLPSE